MQKLKLCLPTLAMAFDVKDGAAKYWRGLYDAMKSRGHDITVLTVKWNEGFDDPNIITVNVPISRFLWMPKYLLTYRKYLKTHDFDIIHGNASRGCLPIMYSGKPYITTMHDLGPFEAEFSKFPIMKYIEKKNARMAKRIITPSEIIRYGIRDYMGVKLEKTYNAYEAIDSKYKPMPTEGKNFRESLGLKGPVLGYVGRLASYKGIDHIIEAFYKARKQIPDLNLVIGGKPEFKMVDTVEQWKRQYPEVRFIGGVPDEQMSPFYSMVDCFVTYSFGAEGFGLTPVEAIACGAPVICSTMPAYKEVLEDNAIFVEPKQPDKLSEAFIKFFKSPDEGKAMVKKAQKFIQRYSWPTVCEKIETIYEGFLQEFGKR
jgi:glycosyltransferase involved in cell wall biosynthesis